MIAPILGAGLRLLALAAASAEPEWEVPAGAREDAALLERTMASHGDLVLQRAQAQAILRQFSAERHDARLAALAKGASGAQKQRALEARRRLGAAWHRLSREMDRRWPLDPRLTCRAPAVDLRGAMAAPPGSAGAAGLPEARLAVRSCLSKLNGVLEPLRRANAAMAAALDEANDVLVGRAEGAPASMPSAERGPGGSDAGGK